MRRLVTCYGLNVVLTLLAMETSFNPGATYGFVSRGEVDMSKGLVLE